MNEHYAVTDEMAHTALEVIVENSHLRALNYAVNYASMGLEMHGRDLQTQIMYVLCNTATWRGDLARATKKVLNEYLAERRVGQWKAT